jgi:hypothetical protein
MVDVGDISEGRVSILFKTPVISTSLKTIYSVRNLFNHESPCNREGFSRKKDNYSINERE